jgi:anti-sigma B factor antagonist
MELKEKSLTESGITVVEISGRIVGGEEAVLLRDKVKRLLAGATDVVLNLSGLTFIDSAGLGALVSLLTSSRAAGRMLRLVSVRGRVRQLLDITRLSSVFEIYGDVDQAVRDKKSSRGASAQ